MSFLTTYKKELVAAIVGALLTGAVTMGAGLYSLSKSFHQVQIREELVDLQKDLFFLTQASYEIDINTQRLLDRSYLARAKFSEPVDMGRIFAEEGKKSKDPKDEPSPEVTKAFLQMMGKVVVMQEFESPSRPDALVSRSWGIPYAQGGQITLDLLRDIYAYYRRVIIIDNYLMEFAEYSPGTQLQASGRDLLLHKIANYNSAVESLKKSDTVSLKNRVAIEIQRLRNKQDKLAASL